MTLCSYVRVYVQVTSWVNRVVKPFAERVKFKDPSLPGKWLQEFFDKCVRGVGGACGGPQRMAHVGKEGGRQAACACTCTCTATRSC